MEKPVAVDPVGARQIMASGEKAKAYNLSVVAGTQRRHQRQYLETYNHIKNGAIGEIVAARAYWNQGQLWYKERQKEWSDMEAMLRDWVNWTWLSGDHIVEQHVHNVDVVATGSSAPHPVKAVGMGGRMRRVTGDQYRFLQRSTTRYENGVHAASQCRQIDGCGTASPSTSWEPKAPPTARARFTTRRGKSSGSTRKTTRRRPGRHQDGGRAVLDGSIRQEHIDLVTAIRTNSLSTRRRASPSRR